jgi:hypothetical protein
VHWTNLPNHLAKPSSSSRHVKNSLNCSSSTASLVDGVGRCDRRFADRLSSTVAMTMLFTVQVATRSKFGSSDWITDNLPSISSTMYPYEVTKFQSENSKR